MANILFILSTYSRGRIMVAIFVLTRFYPDLGRRDLSRDLIISFDSPDDRSLVLPWADSVYGCLDCFSIRPNMLTANCPLTLCHFRNSSQVLMDHRNDTVNRPAVFIIPSNK